MNFSTISLIFSTLCISSYALHGYDVNSLDSQAKLFSNDTNLIEITGLSPKKLDTAISTLKIKERIFVNSICVSYQTVVDLINRFDCSTVCEVGVAYGWQSIEILRKTNVTKLYGIDPYQLYSDITNLSQLEFDLIAYLVNLRFSLYPQRATLIRRTSIAGALLFNDCSLDFIYIDGDHSYDAAKNDLLSWYNKVKPGGIFSGDDYDSHEVKRAVNEFVQKEKLTLNIINATWWLQKPLA